MSNPYSPENVLLWLRSCELAVQEAFEEFQATREPAAERRYFEGTRELMRARVCWDVVMLGTKAA